jgi:hypothetical protein
MEDGDPKKDLSASTLSGVNPMLKIAALVSYIEMKSSWLSVNFLL